MTQARRRRGGQQANGVRLLANGFPVLETKLVPPPSQVGLLRRTSLIERLAASRDVPIVAILAPAGYGKSTLLAQWAESDRRDFAWISIDARDNDPSVLLGYIAFALGGAAALGPDVDQALAAPGSSIWTSAVPRLGAALASRKRSFVLVLDDVDALTTADAPDAMVALASHLRPGSQFVLAGRTAGRIPMPRILAGGRGALFDSRDLALADQEADAVMRAAGVELRPEDLAAVTHATEGWPAGIYLTALALRSRSAEDRRHSTGVPSSDGLVADYIRAELLGRLSDDELGFLLDASALERLSGPLCDAVMQRSDSAARLEEFSRTNLLLIPLDDQHQWYRYHHLLRDHLLAELNRRSTERRRDLHARAAAWHEAEADDETALDYAMLAGDIDLAARLLPQLAQRAYNSGRIESLRRWFESMDAAGVARTHSDVAVVGAILFALLDDPIQAERWARYVHEFAPAGTDPNASAMLSFGRAFLCRSGVDAMRIDAQAALEGLGQDSQWRPLALLVRGAAELASSDGDAAEETLEAATTEARIARVAQGTAASAYAYRAVIAMSRGDWDGAEALAGEGLVDIGEGLVGEQVPAALVDAVMARVALHRGDTSRAREHLSHAGRLRPLLTVATPWAAIRARLDLAHARLGLGDAPGARTLLAEVRDILVRRPHMGALVDEAADLQRRVQALRGEAVGASTLTMAELRLLPLLTSHLSFREIGAQLFVSHNTVKTQAISIYRKLDATSRSEAIQRAVDVGLLEAGGAAHRFIPSG